MGTGRRRILHVLKGLGAGGAEHLVLSQARLRTAACDDMHVAYVLPWKDALVDRLESEGVPTRCLGGLATREDPRWPIRLRSEIDRVRPDVVHVHSPVSASVARLAVRTMRDRPAVLSTEHNTWQSHHRLTRLLNRATIRLSDHVVAVSTEVRRSMPASYQDMVEVLIHGVMLDDLHASADSRDDARTEMGAGPDDFVVVTVANLRRTKAYPDLLAAAGQVLAENPRVQFWAIGQGPLEEDIRSLRDRLGLQGRFHLLGYRADVPRLLAGADLFTLASVHEGYPVAVMEAMVAGLPVVATKVGGVPDAITDGVEGILVRPGDQRGLAEALLGLACDADRRAAMSAAARREGQRHDIRHAVARLEHIYQQIAISRGRR